MTKLFETLKDDTLKKLAKDTVGVGDVYRIKLGKDNGIVPKGGDEFRNKFFVVLGFDDNGNAYGGVIVNSNINRNVPQSIQDWHMPIKCSKYAFLTHDSFVDCSTLKSASIDKFGRWEYKGIINEEDLNLIIATIKSSPNESKMHLAMYGL